METFPGYVNVFENGYSETRKSDLRVTEFERGPKRKAPINCVPMYEISINIAVCEDDYLSFLKWYDESICHGSSWFRFLDPILNKYRIVRFSEDDLNFRKDFGVFTSTMRLKSWGRPLE